MPEGLMEMRKSKKRVSAVARAAIGALLGAGMMAASAQAQSTPPPVFDWSVVDASGNANYTPAPILTDATASAVNAFLTSRGSKVLAVKIVTPISAATANLIFNNHNVKYIFADFESSNALAQTTALVNQIKASTKSSAAFIGEFNMYDVSNDGTRPSPVTSSAASFPTTPFTENDYHNSGVTMANPAAYPGSPDFPSTPTSQDPFPNLRSAFFVLPVDRVTFATDFLAVGSYSSTMTGIKPGNFQNIPWVARFNNWGNNALNNAPGYQGYKYAFNTTGANNPYANQLLSAGDFQAQMLQYRLRGATSYNLFNYSIPGNPGGINMTNSSVIGYSVSEEQTDAYDGFNAISGGSTKAPNITLAAIWQRNNYAFANLANNVPTAPGKVTSAVATGMVLSGIYDVSGSTRQLALMLSNLNSKSESVDFWQKYGGISVDLNGKTAALDQVYTIQPGVHQLLQFNLTGGKWVLFRNDEVFADSNRNGVGVPEPASIGLFGLAGAGLLLRRRRQTA
jgi:hypothetical protein